MLSKNKVRLMTKLAIYDKKFGAGDRKKNEFFKWDYVYFQNFWTRTGVLFGCLLLAIFYVVKIVFVDETDVLTLDIKNLAVKIGFYIICTLVVYTIIGSLVAQKEYLKSAERLADYFKTLDELDRYYGAPSPQKPRKQKASADNKVVMPQINRQFVKNRASRPEPERNAAPQSKRARQKFEYSEKDDKILYDENSINLQMKLKGVSKNGYGINDKK